MNQVCLKLNVAFGVANTMTSRINAAVDKPCTVLTSMTH